MGKISEIITGALISLAIGGAALKLYSGCKYGDENGPHARVEHVETSSTSSASIGRPISDDEGHGTPSLEERLAEARGVLTIDRTYELRATSTPVRKDTSYIVLHTTEGRNSAGKIRRDRSANYLISIDGTINSIVPEKNKANHAGLSQWDGIHYMNGHSIGIEVEGTHKAALTPAQYTAVRRLVAALQNTYQIPDKNVVSHSQIAYGCGPHTLGLKIRGRKKCGSTFDWNRLGIDHATHDDDVAHGYILADEANIQKNGTIILPDGTEDTLAHQRRLQKSYVQNADAPGQHMYRIGKGQMPSKIVGQAYDDPTTWYFTGKRWQSARDVNFRKLQIGDYIITGSPQRPSGIPTR